VSLVPRCDGCLQLIEGRAVITGERTDGYAGGGLPIASGHPFHWCDSCARVAFSAVLKARRGEKTE
jgi:hypothetical protein